MTILGVNLNPYDEVEITCTTHIGNLAVRVVKPIGEVGGGVGTEGRLKIWPENSADPQLPGDHGNKLWFRVEDIEAIRVVTREDGK
jgi:hypothetical protein